jgi:hypothetical protein
VQLSKKIAFNTADFILVLKWFCPIHRSKERTFAVSPEMDAVIVIRHRHSGYMAYKMQVGFGNLYAVYTAIVSYDLTTSFLNKCIN